MADPNEDDTFSPPTATPFPNTTSPQPRILSRRSATPGHPSLLDALEKDDPLLYVAPPAAGLLDHSPPPSSTTLLDHSPPPPSSTTLLDHSPPLALNLPPPPASHSGSKRAASPTLTSPRPRILSRRSATQDLASLLDSLDKDDPLLFVPPPLPAPPPGGLLNPSPPPASDTRSPGGLLIPSPPPASTPSHADVPSASSSGARAAP